MKLPSGGGHSERIERNRILEAADGQNHKRNRDVEIGVGTLWLTSSGGVRWAVTITDAGALGTADGGGASGSQVAYSPGAFTIATETSRAFGPSLKLTGTQRAAVEGTGRMQVRN